MDAKAKIKLLELEPNLATELLKIFALFAMGGGRNTRVWGEKSKKIEKKEKESKSIGGALWGIKK